MIRRRMFRAGALLTAFAAGACASSQAVQSASPAAQATQAAQAQAAQAQAQAQAAVAPAANVIPAETLPTPESYLGFKVGADRHLADWNQVLGYLTELAQASPRVKMDTLGQTTLGRPFVMLTISSEANMRRLEHYREINGKLADPRRITSPAEAEQLIHEGKTVVLITATIHSTEVGGTQMTMALAHQLACAPTATEKQILDNVILLLIPSLNPDGQDMVVHWYDGTLGKPWEGTSPPFLYHYYTGHDNNRDWYYFSQKETQLTVKYAHNAWHPQIVHDIHQQGSYASRFFIPPWIDPVEPNVDPLIIEEANDLGTYMAWRMGIQGKKGIVVNATYDAWTPARAYQHYHAGVRILTETASARLATPITVRWDQLRPGRNFDSRVASWNFMEPWPGGEWHLSNIVDYMQSGAMALLTHAAENREAWLHSFLRIGQRAVGGWDRWPAAWVIPPDQANHLGQQELQRVMVQADVEVRRAEQPFRAQVRLPDSTTVTRDFPAGSWVIPMKQPYAGFAQAMLERQHYPDLREYPGGPPKRPYDVTAQTLPLMLGVDAFQATSIDGGLSALSLSAPMTDADLMTKRSAPDMTAPLTRAGAPRVAVYQSYSPSMDEGWTRWVFDQLDVPYTTVHDADIRAGYLLDRFDALLLPEQSAERIIQGRDSGSIDPKYVGGIGQEGVQAIRDFVRGGGTLVTLNEAGDLAIQALDLPVKYRLDGLKPQDYYIPGSFLRLDVDTSQPEAAGMPQKSIAWVERGSMAFDVTDTSVKVIARYGQGTPLLSGWALGQAHIAGQPALVEVPVGKGRAVLFGFRPQYRAQTVATYRLLFNALAAGAMPGS
ncbi:MAG: M14 family metallopeptidase [Gemmatimonadota bacterium]